MRARVERGCQCQLVRRGDLRCRRRVTRRCTRKFFLAFRHSWKQYVCHSYHPTFILVCLPSLLRKQTTKRLLQRWFGRSESIRNRNFDFNSFIIFCSSVCPSTTTGSHVSSIEQTSSFFFFFWWSRWNIVKAACLIGDDPQCVRSVERETNHEKLHKLTFCRFCSVRYCRLKTSRVVPDNESICENNQKRLHAKWTAERSDRIHVSVLRYRWTSVRRAVSLRPDDNTKRLLQDVSTALI